MLYTRPDKYCGYQSADKEPWEYDQQSRDGIIIKRTHLRKQAVYLNIISMKCYEFYGMHCYNIAGRNERECSVKEKKERKNYRQC